MPCLQVLLLVCLCALDLGAQDPDLKLTELPALARARAQRQRPQLEQALAPFLDLLSLDPDEEDLEDAIAKVVALGDNMVPLLLEKLIAQSNSSEARNLARNCALILQQHDLTSYSDSLLELARNSKKPQAQQLGIYLLGFNKQPGIDQALLQLLPQVKGRQRREALQALTRLGSAVAAMEVTRWLPLAESQDQNRAMAYLLAVRDPQTLPLLLRGLGKTRRPSRMLDYVKLIEAITKADDKAALALLPLLDLQQLSLDSMQMQTVCRALATVAPANHQPSIQALLKLLENGRTGAPELQAAQTLVLLGDKSGRSTLLRSLQQRLRGPGKRNYRNHSMLGDFYREFGEYGRAHSAYKDALELTNGFNTRRQLYINMARCEAHRSRWKSLQAALVKSGASRKTLLQAAADYPELAKAFQEPKLQKFLQGMQ